MKIVRANKNSDEARRAALLGVAPGKLRAAWIDAIQLSALISEGFLDARDQCGIMGKGPPLPTWLEWLRERPSRRILGLVFPSHLSDGDWRGPQLGFLIFGLRLAFPLDDAERAMADGFVGAELPVNWGWDLDGEGPFRTADAGPATLHSIDMTSCSDVPLGPGDARDADRPPYEDQERRVQALESYLRAFANGMDESGALDAAISS